MILNMSKAVVVIDAEVMTAQVAQAAVGCVWKEIEAAVEGLRASLESEAEQRLVRDTFDAVVEFDESFAEDVAALARGRVRVRLVRR